MLAGILPFTLALVMIRVLWFRTLLLLYLVYCFLDPSPQNGRGHGKRLSPQAHEWIRSNYGFGCVARFFPIRLHKTADLDPKQAYILCYHPHGVISMGAITALCTNGCGFNEVFPGLRRFGITLNVTFVVPLFREWLLAQGFISSNKATLTRELQAGNSLVLIAGGATEALLAHPDLMSLVGQNRRGFCKLAVENGAQLVPCLGFGENKAFQTFVPDPVDTGAVGRWLVTIQRTAMKIMQFSMPIMTHPLPTKTSIDVVVGKPIAALDEPPCDAAVDNDAWDPVEDLHRRYWQAVVDLYDENKVRFGYESIPLTLL